LKAIDVDESTTQAIEDWHYWIAKETSSDIRAPAENSQMSDDKHWME
jgi:hypothetical protein